MNNNIKLCHRKLYNLDSLSKLDIPDFLKEIYSKRGIQNPNDLNYEIKNLLPFNKLFGINKAVDIIVESLYLKNKFMIIGDFDVDGATSITLIVLLLRKFGSNDVNFLVPNRYLDGNGLSSTCIEQAACKNIDLIITVDLGINSHESIILAHKKGIKVIVTDHHIPDSKIQYADAVVNPNLYNCKFSSKFLSGVGVAFYLMLAVLYKLKKLNWFKKHKIDIPKLTDFLDLVAIGTIVDMVPFDLNNRILVYNGLQHIRAGLCRIGILALIKFLKFDISSISTNDISFFIGPMLNAAGRIDNMETSIYLLLTEDINYAKILIKKLDKLNKERIEINKKMQIESFNTCNKIINFEKKTPVCFVLYDKTWHQGIVGIVSSKIKNIFNRPNIILAPYDKKFLKGSGRSINGFNIYQALDKLNTKYPGIICSFGGHKLAIGLKIHKSKFIDFCNSFKYITNMMIDKKYLTKIVWSDGILNDQDICLKTAEIIRDNGPWGQNFPEPLFDGYFLLINYKIIKNKHLKLILKSINNNCIFYGIVFDIDKKFWETNLVKVVKITYKLQVNKFNNINKLQLLICNIWPY
ncbi:MAG: single-stranded-DNA-specific exonuclease RecJ [Enterobacterales bacterium]